MKKRNIHLLLTGFRAFMLLALTIITGSSLIAQETTEVEKPVVKKVGYTKNTFGGNLMIDNQTVMVPVKGTFEFAINHRFGNTAQGIKDLYGIFGTANMRLGFAYVPIKDLQLGFGANNYNMIVDANLKYSLLKQKTDNSMPVSVTYFGSAAMDTRAKNPALPIVNVSDRFSFFNQLMVARKMSDKLSLQASLNFTYFNNVEGYYDAENIIQSKMKNEHLSFALSGRCKIADKTAIIVNYDQPLTQHPMNNPRPNISVGLDMNSSGHGFQVFAGNYSYSIPQYNNMFNQNDFNHIGQWVIGFNMTRLWNF